MRGSVGWSGETPDAFFATVGEEGSGMRHYMIVEALPNGGWDWVAWAADGSGRCVYGTEPYRTAAMISAECAAALLRIRLVQAPAAAERMH